MKEPVRKKEARQPAYCERAHQSLFSLNLHVQTKQKLQYRSLINRNDYLPGINKVRLEVEYVWPQYQAL
jgi:hypothetical protein